jgi:DNA polymerase III subunit delta
VNYDSILLDIKNGKFSPVYCFHGDEPYYIDRLVDYIEDNALPESAKAFNQTTVFGKDIDAKAILDEARQYPLMSEKRLIVVKEAQEMKTLKDLADYVNKPVPHTILVLSHKYKKIDKRLAISKALEKHVFFESKKMYDNQLPNFILQYARAHNIGINDQGAQMLSEFLGNDLNKITNELDKLLITNGKGNKISIENIQDQIGISKEFNVFELQKALGEKDRVKSFLITKYFAENPKDNPIQVTVSNLYSYFMKVMIAAQHIKDGDAILQKKMGLTSAYFLKDYKQAAKHFTFDKLRDIIVALRQVDIESKGVNNKSKNDGQLLTELVHTILN